MKIERGGIATVAIVAIAVIVIVVVAVSALFLLKPGEEVLPTPTGQPTPTPTGQATPTPTPTRQATPTPGGEVIPKPGATLTGPIEISGKASSGTISLTISEDGASVTSVSITLNDLECDGFSAGSYSAERQGSFPVTGGAFSASLSDIGTIEGLFTSPTEASGTINLVLEIPYAGTFELGTWNWSAKAD